MGKSVLSGVGVGFGVGLGLAVGGGLLAIGTAFAAGQSGAPPPPVPTVVLPAATVRPVVSGANIPEKVLMYERRVSGSAISGGIVNVEAACDDRNDTIVTGSCTAPTNAAARIWSTDILAATATGSKTVYRCSFSNDGRSSVQVEALIVCRRPR